MVKNHFFQEKTFFYKHAICIFMYAIKIKSHVHKSFYAHGLEKFLRRKIYFAFFIDD